MFRMETDDSLSSAMNEDMNDNSNDDDDSSSTNMLMLAPPQLLLPQQQQQHQQQESSLPMMMMMDAPAVTAAVTVGVTVAVAAAVSSTVHARSNGSRYHPTAMGYYDPNTTHHNSNNNINSNNNVERRRALDAVGRNATNVWKTLPREWQLDKEFILKVLKESPSLPPKSEFERTFPQSLRFDKEVVLGFCHRSDFKETFYTRHLFVPGCWINDKDVMLAYCKTIPRSLQECSDDLVNDRGIVQAAIQLGGLELQYASLRLQEDKDIVVQACHSHGRALEYCPPNSMTRRQLVQDRDFMLNVVLAKPGGGPMWKLLPPSSSLPSSSLPSLQSSSSSSLSLKQDPQLLLQALKHGLGLRHIPTDFMNLDFLNQAIQANAILYLELPSLWQSQFQLSLTAVLQADATPDIHKRAFSHNGPSLSTNRQAVLAICKTGTSTFLQDLLTEQQDVFGSDVEIMKLAVARDSKLFSLASNRLQELPELILVSITPASAWNTLKTVPWAIQRQHPEIPIKAIQLCLLRNLRYLPSHIPEDLWASPSAGAREVCVAWMQRGGRVLEAFERLLKTDADLALLVAQHNWSEFHKVGDAWLSDRDFISKALQKDGRVLRFAAPALRQDFELLVMAVAHHHTGTNHGTTTDTTNPHPNAHPHPAHPHHHQHPHYHQQQQQQQHRTLLPMASVQSTLHGICTISELQTQIQQQLELHNSFVFGFLRGIAIVTPHIPPAHRSALHMLDRGVETSQALKRLIAEYLGVPVGGQLQLLRQAQRHLVMTTTTTSTSQDTNDAISTTTTTTTTAGNAAAVSWNNANHFLRPRHPQRPRRRRLWLEEEEEDDLSNSDRDDDDEHQHQRQQQQQLPLLNEQERLLVMRQRQNHNRLLLLQEELENDLEMEFLI
jgi:hypothetical protein